jgi:predicted nucleic acid-binding protein
MSSKGEVDSAISEFGLERLRANDTVLFRAGAAYKVYRSRQGAVKTNVLPDFLIGALAEVLDIPLITANPKDFAGYFPSVRLITPPTTKNPT